MITALISKRLCKNINARHFAFHSVLFILIFIRLSDSFGQGCSDAGFCTINSFKPHADSVELKNRFNAGVSYGSADHSIRVFGYYVEYDRMFTDRFSVDVKVGSLSQNGNGIYEYGFSDVYLNTSYAIGDIRLTAGIKIPLTDGNKMLDGLSLPMDYQSSLGTLDLVAGAGISIQKLQVVIAVQQPLTQNENQFFAGIYPEGSVFRDFTTTRWYVRSGDALIRVSYPISLRDKLKVTPSLLPIYHLQNDEYTDLTGMHREIEGSQGLTFNANLYLDFMLNNTHAFQFNAGMPFITRDVRPDGLTRHFIFGVEYGLSF